MIGVGDGAAELMDVWWIPPGGPPKRHNVEDLPVLLRRDDGFCWVDVPHCDERAAGVLAEVFGAHPLAVRDCREANSTGKVHAYPDHVLLVLHSPEPGQGGQAHLVELDQLVSDRYLVTVHGPFGPDTDFPHLAVALTIMGVAALATLVWARRQGWW